MNVLRCGYKKLINWLIYLLKEEYHSRKVKTLITAPLESLPLVRKIVEYAYKEGAGIESTF